MPPPKIAAQRPDQGRRTRARVGRAKKTVAVKTLTKNVIAAGWTELGGKSDTEFAVNKADRPRTWGDCQATGLGCHGRPCPWVSCKYSLFLDVTDTGSIILNHPDLEPLDLTHTCALRVAELGGATLEEVGEILNVTRERIRQIEVRAMTRKLASRLSLLKMNEP